MQSNQPLITPSKLSLFSRSPIIGAWWEELDARRLFDGQKPEVSALDQQLFDDGIPRFQESCHPFDQYTRGLEDMSNACMIVLPTSPIVNPASSSCSLP